MTPNNLSLGSTLHFKKAEKTKGLHAMHVQDAIKCGIIGPDWIVNTLEGPITASADSMICKGAAGELWPQKLEEILSEYDEGDREQIITSDPVQIWTEYLPKPGNIVGAAQVTDRETFTIDASWGTLNGKSGDYVLQDDRGGMCIVAKDVFENTYEFKKTGCCGGCGCKNK